MGTPWHALSAQETATRLEVDPAHGLSPEEIARRQAVHGPNRLTASRPTPWWLTFLRQFHQPLIYILLASSAITAALGEWVDSGVIFGVVIVNAVVGFFQESRAENAIRALAKMVTTHATVLRAGMRVRVGSEAITPGDIVLLEPGDRVPADLRLLRVRELAVDESTLTGESVPAAKHAGALDAGLTLADRCNMAYAGTLVSAGHGTGVVTAIGDATETGRISRLIQSAPDLSTPLTRRIKAFSLVLLYAILVMAAFTFAVGVARGQPAVDMFMAAVALAVGAIPEGLPAAVTITLAIGVNRMARRRAIIRRLPAVETLGSTTVICSDKTGTLTENQMTVQAIHAGGVLYQVTGSGYAPEGGILLDGRPVQAKGALHECLLAGLLCNDAGLEHRDGRWVASGDPTEAALLAAAAKAGLQRQEMESTHPRRDTVPFESGTRYMATLHDSKRVYVKGAVERLLPRCTTELGPDGHEQPLDAGAIEAAAARLAGAGLRVLAFARGLHEGERLEHAHLSRGLVFLGLQAMIDPPRPEAVAAIRACHQAGIAVKMITGDHAATATAIAARLELLAGPDPAPPLTGQQLAELDDQALAQAARVATVFARVEPEQKLRLVRALQAGGQVVAMTGDGVNDAPALKAADIGIAMGLSGTEVAREAAHMLLTDDNFASIKAAVEEGRGVHDNLVKFITWTLPTNFGEGMVILAAIVAGVTLPITPLQILWINMTTAVLLGLMLAFEPIEAGVMRRSPRNPRAPILDRRLVTRILLVGAIMLTTAFGLFMWETRQGTSLDEARTVAVNVFVMCEIFYLFNCRSLTHSVFHVGLFSNPWIWVGVGTMILLQLLFTYLPAMNVLFQTAPMQAGQWLEVLVAGLLVYFAVDLEERLQRRRPT
jgi:Ca2+-transporting ATPase